MPKAPAKFELIMSVIPDDAAPAKEVKEEKKAEPKKVEPKKEAPKKPEVKKAELKVKQP